MDPLFFLYGLIVLVLILGALVVVYHILKYSLNDGLRYFGATTFLFFFFFFLFVNFFSFQSLEATPLGIDFELGPILPDESSVVPTFQKTNW